jgi:hypothetical protein
MKRYVVDVLVSILLTSVFSLGSWALGVGQDYKSNIQAGFPTQPSPVYVCRECLPGEPECIPEH